MLNKEILERLKEREGLTDTDLGDYIGTSQTSFSHYKQGLKAIPAWRLKRLADRCGVTMDELFIPPAAPYAR